MRGSCWAAGSCGTTAAVVGHDVLPLRPHSFVWLDYFRGHLWCGQWMSGAKAKVKGLGLQDHISEERRLSWSDSPRIQLSSRALGCQIVMVRLRWQSEPDCRLTATRGLLDLRRQWWGFLRTEPFCILLD